MNCLRSAEYIKKIDKAYKEYGLETILLHPPEWDFEKVEQNVCENLKENDISFPFLLDTDWKIIGKFGLDFWPTQILVAEGKVIYKHIGEGDYKELEDAIIKALNLKQVKRLFSKEPEYSKHPTVYCGTRKKGVIRPVKAKMNGLRFGVLYTNASWNQESEYLQSMEENCELTLMTKGSIVNFVAESLTKEPVRVILKIKNKIVGNILVNGPKLYRLLELETDKQEILTLTVEKGLAIYAFSFQ